MPYRLTPSELALAIAEAVYGTVPDLSESLEPDEADSGCTAFRMLP